MDLLGRVAKSALAGALAVLLALAVPDFASAVTLQPTRFDDPTPNACLPTDCSLREAVNAVTASQPKTIVLKAGTYVLQQGAPLDIFQNGDQSTTFTIQGAGAGATVINANSTSRVVSVTEGSDAVTINDVTITGGNASASQATNAGGVFVDVAAALSLNRAAVAGNRATQAGAGIYATGGLTVNASTISGNVVGPGSVTAAEGAGVYVNSNTTTLTNTTLSGNVVAGGGQGGGVSNASNTVLRNVTIAGNTATSGFFQTVSGGATVTNSIITSDAGAACAGSPAVFVENHNLDDDTTCQFNSTGDKSGVNPGLGPLAFNGGPTQTRALPATSPAINAGAGCPATDQRGVARSGACDIGAYEFRFPRLTVIKRVVNNHGGTQAAGDFNVHVRSTADVAGSPAPGSASGRTYVLAPGTYTVSEDADSRYTRSFSGTCNSAGAVALGEGQVATCTITNDDKPPSVRKFVNAAPKSGIVRIKLPNRKRFRRLTEGEQLPVGTVVDTLRGKITLYAAANRSGGIAKADFYAGIFKIGQTKGKRPITVLTLVEKLTGCPTSKGKKASAAAKKKKKRRLWGNGKGRFRTKGKRSAATVVGTKWLVEDRCDSTLTKVVRGRVSVRDFVAKKTVIVKKGKRYIARAR